MSTDTPTPERVTLTDEEWSEYQQIPEHGYSHRFWLESVFTRKFAAREQALRDEIARLSRWKEEALPVLDGLQEIGRALGLPLGERITDPAALVAIERLIARGSAR